MNPVDLLPNRPSKGHHGGMTHSATGDDFEDLAFEQDPDAVLHSFAVMARFRRERWKKSERTPA